MVYLPDSNLARIKNLEKALANLTDQLIFMTPVNSIPVSYSNSGNRDATHGPLTGLEVLPPVVHFLTGGSSDQITISASNVIIDQVGASALRLKTILNTPNNGVRISALSVKAGKTLTLKTGGNLAITTDIVLTDQDICYLVYSQDIGNKYRVITSKGSSGAGTLWSGITIDVTKDMHGFGLSNLNFITFLNSDGKIRQINSVIGTGMIFDLGTAPNPIIPSENYFFKVNGVETARITAAGILPGSAGFTLGDGTHQWTTIVVGDAIITESLSTTKYLDIFRDGTTHLATYNTVTPADNIRGHRFQQNGSTLLDVLGAFTMIYTDIAMNSNAVRSIGSFGIGLKDLWFGDAGSDPTQAGQMRLNGIDFKVFSGGAVRNLSLIGTYANQSLSNLTTTSINQDLIPAASKNLGGSSNFWISSFVQNMVVGVAANSISKDASNNMLFGVPTGKSFEFTVNNVLKLLIDTSNLNAPNLDAQFNSIQNLQFLAFANGGLDPFSNGMFEMNGTNMKVMSGGVVKDFTQMPQLNGANTFTNTNTFNSTVFIKTQTFLILNSNDTSDAVIRQSTAPGVVPKQVDIESFGDVCFKAIGETSSLLSRGLIKAMQKAGDPTTTDIPAGFFAVNKNTSSGAVKAWYNDGGTLKSVTLT